MSGNTALPIAIRRHFPPRDDPSPLLQPVQCRVERPVLHLQEIVRGPLDALADMMAMSGAIQKRAEDQHIQGALEQLRPLLFFLSGHGRHSILGSSGRISNGDSRAMHVS